MKHLALFSLLLFSLTSTVQAGILIEPYAGLIVSGDGEITVNNTKFEYSRSGTLYGGRIGYSQLGLMFGAQYEMNSIELETDSPASSAGDTSDWDATNMGLFVGYNFPLMLRVWGTYFLNSELDFDGSGGNYSGSGYALGAGWTGLPFLSLNLEYRSYTYDELENTNGTTVDLPTNLISEREASDIILSLSFPFDF